MKHALTLVFAVSMYTVAKTPKIYQCESKQGIIFSQFPCPPSHTQNGLELRAVNTSSKAFAAKDTLNNYSQMQKKQRLLSKIKGTQSRINALYHEEEEKIDELTIQLDRIMSKKDKKRLEKSIDKERQKISFKYEELIKRQKAKLKSLNQSLQYYDK